MSADLARILVLISGSGSNLQAILDAAASSYLPARVVGVISNQPDAFGLLRAQKAGVPGEVIQKLKEQSRTDYDILLAERAAAYRPDWIVLAGWMRLLSSAFLNRFPGREINLHPALPGTFPGTHAIERAFSAFQAGEIAQTGIMVHLVPDEGVDSGPVLAVEPVAIEAEDSLESLEARIHQTEHRLLVETLYRLIKEEIKPFQME
jgi:phosphoribosylglycinamide formyltransferase 1